jgi:hyperosmotically inducible protein
MKISSLMPISAICLSIFGSAALAEATNTQPDNSAVNARDHHADAKTADHQGRSTKRDVDLTRMIRRELTKDSSLSTYAKNIKIVTEDGNVTLRGPVHTNDEKMKVESIAQKIVGQANIQNELEIKQ